MVNVKTTCDKCGKEINGRIYKVSVGTTGVYRYSQLQAPKYGSYDICPECMESVITDDVVGVPFFISSTLSPIGSAFPSTAYL